MRTKKEQWLICILFCGFLGIMMLLYLLLPKGDFSALEKRYLAESPILSWESLTSGEYSEEVDTFMADHIPGRSFFVGLNACYELVTGRQGSKDILMAKGNWLVEAPVKWDTAAAAKNMTVINQFSEQSPVEVDLMLVPSAGWASGDSLWGFSAPYEDEAIIRNIYAMAEDHLNTVDVASAFAQTGDPASLYYRTDHHWTSAGAYTAYRHYMEQLGQAYRPEADWQVETIDGFHGSTYTRSALWMIPGEEIELWHGSENITVTHEESTQPHAGVFFRNRLEEADKYTVFLDGNHSLVRLENPDAAGTGKLLVIRDSFCNSLGGFLAESYESVVLVDLRYYRKGVSELLAQEEFDRVLICYSIGNFLTDTNVVWLR